jgi:hypothetical protein
MSSMKFELDLHEEFVDNLVVARLKDDYETVQNGFVDDSEELMKAIVILMSYHMCYDDYFKWRAEADVPESFIGEWDRYREMKLLKGEE